MDIISSSNKKKSPKKSKTIKKSERNVSPSKQKLIQTIEESAILKDVEVNKEVKELIISEAFELFDTDGSGSIDIKEFKKLIKSLGIEKDQKEITELWKEYDKDNSGYIDKKEFRQMMIDKFTGDQSIKTHLSTVFTLYDKDENQVITEEDLLLAAKELNIKLEDEDALLIIDLAHQLSESKMPKLQNSDKSYGIDKENFIELLLKIGFLVEVNQKETKESNKDVKEGKESFSQTKNNTSISGKLKESKNESRLSDGKSKSHSINKSKGSGNSNDSEVD